MSIKQQEEIKRSNAYDPVTRWKQIQEMIAWAEANSAPHLRRNRPRVRKSFAEKTNSLRTRHKNIGQPMPSRDD